MYDATSCIPPQSFQRCDLGTVGRDQNRSTIMKRSGKAATTPFEAGYLSIYVHMSMVC